MTGRAVNVERARRMVARHAESATDRRRWLAGLTPEHRALHEGPFAAMCSTCAARAFADASEAMTRVLGGSGRVR